MAGTDMTIRILRMYEKLRCGKEIQKIPFCMEHEISERTFDRDIEKIRLFLSEEYSGREVQYLADSGCYKIPGQEERGELSIVEFILFLKLLKGEAPLEKQEYQGVLNSLQTVTEKGREEKIQKLIQEALEQYEERKGKSAYLKFLGDLEDCIEDRNIIRLLLKENADSGTRIIFLPVAIEYEASELYLLGYQPEEEGLKVVSIEEIESFQITMKKYGEEIETKYSYQEGRSLLRNMKKKRRGYRNGKKN